MLLELAPLAAPKMAAEWGMNLFICSFRPGCKVLSRTRHSIHCCTLRLDFLSAYCLLMVSTTRTGGQTRAFTLHLSLPHTTVTATPVAPNVLKIGRTGWVHRIYILRNIESIYWQPSHGFSFMEVHVESGALGMHSASDILSLQGLSLTHKCFNTDA